MKMNELKTITFVSLRFLLLAGLCWPAAPAALGEDQAISPQETTQAAGHPKPNLVFLLADDLRPDCLGVLGHPQPPLAALVTYCHFAAVYGRSPVGLPVPATLKSLPDAGAMNRLLQELVWQAVISYPLSGMRAEPPAAMARPRSQ